MSQALARRRLTRDSLRGHEDPRTVLLRMALDTDRAARIRSLKQEHPDLTWADIAEAVGVKERSAIDWQKTGGISHPNCKKLAKVFHVDPDWLWSGAERGGTADLMGALRNGDGGQLDRIEAKLDRLLSLYPGEEEELPEALEREADRTVERRSSSAATRQHKQRTRRAS